MGRIVGAGQLAGRRGLVGRADLVDDPGSTPACLVCGHTSGACRGEADQSVVDAVESDPDRLVPAPSVVVADDGTIVARAGDMVPASVAQNSILAVED